LFSFITQKTKIGLHFLLPSLLLLFILFPFLETTTFGNILIDILTSTVLIIALTAITHKKLTHIIATIFAFLAIIFNWADHFTMNIYIIIAGFLCNGIFLIFIAWLLFYNVIKERSVTIHTINRAVSVYFLIGLFFAFFYAIIEQLWQGSFTGLKEASRMEFGIIQVAEFTYYSFSTLTSTGFGDILPKSSFARSISVLEAILGQLYIAILIARLVGMHLVHSDGK